MWDLTLDYYTRVYSCVKHKDYYKCKRFATEEAANMYRSYYVHGLFKDENQLVPLIHFCRFTPSAFDRQILKFKLKEPVLLH